MKQAADNACRRIYYLIVRVRLLGPLVVEGDGIPVAVKGAKERAILALLAARANNVVSVDTLIDELWGERPPPSAKKSLQAYLTRLRHHIEPTRKPGERGSRIQSINGGYRLTAGHDELDLLEFEDLVRLGQDSLRVGALATAYSTLGDALDLWRGAPFHGFESPLIVTETSRYEELRRQAFDDRIEVALLMGRHHAVIAELEAALVTDPFRESLWRQLMVALYRSGRQAEAVAAFDRARATLLENLGLEPSRDLQSTLELILNQNPSLDGPQRDTTWFPARLEHGDSVFVGRDAEQATIDSWWPPKGAAVGWVFGSDGIGKTRLAGEVAASLRRRGIPVLYGSALPATSDPLRALRRALSVLDSGDRIPDGTQLERRFGHDGLLMVLDDVGSAGPSVADALTTATRGVSMPLLVLLLADSPPGETLGPLVGDRCVELGQLSVDEVTQIAEGYAGEDATLAGSDVYMRTGGTPALVHQAAAEWARQRAKTRLAVAVSSGVEQRQLISQTDTKVLGELTKLQDLELLRQLQPELLDPERPPYRGLSRYEVDDADLFFGREKPLRQLILKLVGGGLVGVVGPSGCGKSSLVRAGLAAAALQGIIPGGPWAPLVMVPGAEPMAQLAEILPMNGLGSERALLIVDQLEQLFIACPDPADRTEFLDSLARLSEGEDAPRVVAVLRADYFGNVAVSPSFTRRFQEGVVIIGPMTAEELHRSIELPAGRYGLRLMPGLVSRLVSDSMGQPGSLPLLSTMLLELWERRHGSAITVSDYLRAGGLDGAVARLAEATYQGLHPERRVLLRRIFLRLAGPGEGATVIARVVPIQSFGEGEAAEVVRTLIEDRLLTSDEETVTVAHEAIFREWPRLAGWLDEDRWGREVYQHLVEAAATWQRGGEMEEDLYRGARLSAALEWRSEEPERLGVEERRFLQASQDLAERVSRDAEERASLAESTTRRLRRLTAAVLVVALIAATAGVVANVQRGQARSEAESALAARLGAEALQQEHLDLSLLLATQARNVVDSGATRGSLLGAVLRAPQALGVMRSGADRLTNVAVSPKGDIVASVSTDARLDLWKTADRTHVATLQDDDWGPASSLAFSPDGNLIAVAEEWGRPTGAVRIWDVSTQTQLHVIELALFAPLLAFTPDGQELLALDVEGGLNHIDPYQGRVTSTEPQLVATGPGGLNLGFSRDGDTLIVSSDSEGLVRSAEGDVRLDINGWALPSPDGALLGIGNLNGEVFLVDAASGETVVELRGHSAAIDDLDFTPDGARLVTSSWDGTVIVWDVATGRSLETYRGHAGRVTGVAVDDRGMVAYSAGLDGALIAWDLTGTDRFGKIPWVVDAHIGEAALVAGGNAIAAASDVGPLLIDVVTGESRVLAEGDFWSVSTTPAAPIVAVAGQTALVFDAQTGETITGPIDLGPEGAGWVAVLPDGSLAVTSSAGLGVWSPAEQLPTAVTTTKMWGLTVSDDGSLLAAGYDDGSVGVWDTAGWQRLTLIEPAGVGDPVLGLDFNPSGTSLLTYNIEGPLRVWNARTGERMTDDLTGHSGFVLDTSFSPDGSSMISVGSDGKVGLWDTSTWRLAGLLPGPSATWGWGWFLDEARVVTLFEDGSSREWSANADHWETWACGVAGRSLTAAEWEDFLPRRPYDPAC